MPIGDFINKAKSLVSGHPEQAKQAFDRVEQAINDKTGGKYADQVAKGESMLQDRLGMPHDQAGQSQTSSSSGDSMQGGSQGAQNANQTPGPNAG